MPDANRCEICGRVPFGPHELVGVPRAVTTAGFEGVKWVCADGRVCTPERQAEFKVGQLETITCGACMRPMTRADAMWTDRPGAPMPGGFHMIAVHRDHHQCSSSAAMVGTYHTHPGPAVAKKRSFWDKLIRWFK